MGLLEPINEEQEPDAPNSNKQLSSNPNLLSDKTLNPLKEE